MNVAAIIYLKDVPEGTGTRVDFTGTDCASIEDALGTLREALVKLPAEEWEVAFIVPGKTVSEIAAMDPNPPDTP